MTGFDVLADLLGRGVADTVDGAQLGKVERRDVLGEYPYGVGGPFVGTGAKRLGAAILELGEQHQAGQSGGDPIVGTHQLNARKA